MKRTTTALASLVTGVVFAASGAVAQTGFTSATTVDKTVTETVDFNWDNDVDVAIDKTITYTKELVITGDIHISGWVNVDNSAMATIDDTQIVNHNSVDIDYAEYNDATLVGNAFSNPLGNNQVNVAAGNYNLQGNETALASPKIGSWGHAEAEIFMYQQISGNHYDNYNTSVNTAALGGYAFANAVGNNQVNVAAGAFNAQKNALAVATASNTVLAEASVAALQQVTDNYTGCYSCTNNARLGDYAFANAVGNNQVNVATGNGNAQANVMSVANGS